MEKLFTVDFHNSVVTRPRRRFVTLGADQRQHKRLSFPLCVCVLLVTTELLRSLVAHPRIRQAGSPLRQPSLSNQSFPLDWSVTEPEKEYVRLIQECATLRPHYVQYVNTPADNVALRGVDIKVFSRVTGGVVSTHWEEGVFLRENGKVLINQAPTFSWARHRQLAWAIVKSAKMGAYPGLEDVESLRDMADSSTNLSIWNTQSESTIHDVLKSIPGYVCSEFLSNKSLNSGDYGLKDGQLVRHEDLMSPSFDDESFDLVISSEVFEHIPFPYLAHRRVHRVLKEGGAHVFTVPFSTLPADTIHATLDPEGQINFAGVPIMHGDPVRPEGVPVFTIFGYEMITKLCTIGFQVYAYELHIPREGILGAGAIVFIARKITH